MPRSFGPLALAALLAAGCAGMQVAGSGTQKEESREVQDFTKVEIGQAIEATIAVGPRAPLKISGDDNLLPLIRTEVRDGTLVTRVEGAWGIRPTRPIRLVVTTPRLERVGGSGASTLDVAAAPIDKFAIDASGASVVAVKGLDSEAVDVEASGASRVTIAGRAKALKLSASGASTVKAAEAPAESVQADISGASRAEVRASSAVRGDISGASDLSVLGQPGTRAVETTGASRVRYESARAGQ